LNVYWKPALFALAFVAALAHGQTAPPPAPTKGAPPAAAPPEPGLLPRVWLNKTQWDFGAIWWGDKCETEIEIRNVGHAPLEIRNVKTSCGCTAIKPNKTRLTPGESDHIRLSYDTEKGVVDVAQTATIETNDPGQPAITLNIRGQVRNLYDGAPTPQLAFGQTCIDQSQTKSIELVNAFGKPLALTLPPQPADAPFNVTLEELERGQRYRMTATTPSPLKAGSQYHYVILTTDSQEHPKFKVVVSAYGMERVELLPTVVTVYSNQSSKGSQERQVRLNYLRERPLRIVSMQSSSPEISATVDPAPAPVAPDSVYAAHLIRLKLPTYDNLSDTGATVEITTDDPDPRFQKLTLSVTRQQMKSQAVHAATDKPGIAPVRNGELPRARPASQPKRKTE
jgi:hypothetical protein